MTEIAKERAELIANYLRKMDHGAAFELERNLNAYIQNAAVNAENTPEIRKTAAALRLEVESLLKKGYGPLGVFRLDDAVEAQRKRAVAAAEAFEEALLAAPASARAKALYGG